jgi:DNA-binding Xre family transcriptional regulator
VPTRFRLRELLAAHDPPMSPSELARQSGVSLVTVNAIANNRTTRVDLETLDVLCRVLKVQPGDLLEQTRIPDRYRCVWDRSSDAQA